MVWTGTPEQEAEAIEKNPNTYFEDGINPDTKAPERYKRWPQKPQRAVAITVDFPQFQYDWGGDVGEKPLRFLLNGEFIFKGGKGSDVVVGRTYDLKETTKVNHQILYFLIMLSLQWVPELLQDSKQKDCILRKML